jgi:hypothetical protein
MMRTWKENRGTNHVVIEADERGDKAEEADEIERQKHILSDQRMTSVWDLRVWAMSFVTCCFEGTIVLFMFFWPETLQQAHGRNRDGKDPKQNDDVIPHGVIFASFMAIMVLGALSFNLMTADPTDGPLGWPRRRALTPTQLLKGTLAVSAIGFSAAAFVREEVALFLSFLLLEVCNGVYVPSVAYHRGVIVTDDARAQIYSLMNIPLFVFVVIALRTAKGGDGESALLLHSKFTADVCGRT